MRATIWSTPTCNFCVKAKTTLNILKIDYEEKIIGKEYTKEQFLEAVPNARTVPQIFIDDVHIGGYDQLREYEKSGQLNKTLLTEDGDNG